MLPISGEAQLRIFNDLDCRVTLNPPIENVSYIPPLSALELLHIQSEGTRKYDTTFGVDPSCSSKLNAVESSINVTEKEVNYFILHFICLMIICRMTMLNFFCDCPNCRLSRTLSLKPRIV